MDAQREVGDGEQHEGVDQPFGYAPGEDGQQGGRRQGEAGEGRDPPLVLDAVVGHGEREEAEGAPGAEQRRAGTCHRHPGRFDRRAQGLHST